MSKIYPFKFLDAYNKNDTALFFGRDEEISALYQMVFQSDILLVYGASGTGKTSLIQCGFAGKFQPHDWLPLFVRRGNDLNASLKKALEDACGITGNETGTTATLAETFNAVYLTSFRPIYLIFDQFEELFILGTKDEQEIFIATAQEILKIEQPVKMIFSMREEYLGHLFDFEKAVPQLMRKKLRIEPMNLEKVGEVIRRATELKDTNISLKPGEEQAIIERIFESVRGKENTNAIQLPYLQVFLDKLYMETPPADDARRARTADAEFSMATLNRMGDIGDVLRDFLEEQAKAISQKLSTGKATVSIDDIWNILSPFATLEGTKAPISMQTLREKLPAAMDKTLVTDTVQEFVDNRILKLENGIYELAHDTLALKIAGKRSDEEVALLEVERLIKSQVALKEDARELFTQKQLGIIDLYWNNLAQRLTDDDKAFIEKSRNALKEKIKAAEQQAREAAAIKEKEKAAQEQKKRILRRQTYAAMSMAMVVLGGLSFWAIKKSYAVEAQKTQLALTSQGLTEFYQNKNATKAFEYGRYAYLNDPTNMNAYTLLYSTLFQQTEDAVMLFYEDIATHDYKDTRIDFSQDGNKMFSIGRDRSIKIFDVSKNKTIIIADTSLKFLYFGPVTTYASSRLAKINFSPAGTMLQVCNDQQIFDDEQNLFLYNAESGKKILSLGYGSSDLFFAPKDNLVLVPLLDSTAKDFRGGYYAQQYGESRVYKYIGVFDPAAGKYTDTITLPTGTKTIRSVIFCDDGSRVAICSNNDAKRTLNVYDTHTGHGLKQCIVNLHDSVYCSFSNDSKLLAIACGNGLADIYDAVTMNKISRSVAIGKFPPYFKSVALNKDYNTIQIKDLVTGTQTTIMPYGISKGIIASALLSPDGQTLITNKGYNNDYYGSDISMVIDIGTPSTLWDIKTGKKIAELSKPGETQQESTFPGIFSPDSKYFMNTYGGSNAFLWDAHTGKQIATLVGHIGSIYKAAFSADCKYLLTSGADSSIKKWSLESAHNPFNSLNSVAQPSYADIATSHGDFYDIGERDADLKHYAKVKEPKDLTVLSNKKLTVTSEYIKLLNTTTHLSNTDMVADKTNCLFSVTFSPDHNYLLETFGRLPDGMETGNGNDFYSALWDIYGNRTDVTYDASHGIFSPDSRFLLLTDHGAIRKGPHHDDIVFRQENPVTLVDVKTGSILAKLYIPGDTSNKSTEPEYSFSKDSKMLMAKYKYTLLKNDVTGEISRSYVPGWSFTDTHDSTLKAWLIDPDAIINKMKNVGDLSSEEKIRYGIK